MSTRRVLCCSGDHSANATEASGSSRRCQLSAEEFLSDFKDFAHWRRQEGVTQVIVNNERGLHQSYQDLVAKSLESIVDIFMTVDPTTDFFRARLLEAISLFMRDKTCLSQQARVVQEVESTLGRVKDRETEISEKLVARFATLLPPLSMPMRREFNGLRDDSQSIVLSSKPTLESLDQLPSNDTPTQGLLEDGNEQSERCPCDDNAESTEASYSSWRLMLEAQLESSHCRNTCLEDDLLAQGISPEIFRRRRSNSCSSADVSDSDWEKIDL